MKQIQTVVACAVALALIGGATLRSAEMGRAEGKAVVRAVHGTVEYEQNGAWMPLRPNKDLAPGVKIRTGPDSYTDLFINGTSTVRITADTTMVIPEMWRIGPARGGDTETTLDLQTGTALGNVKKLSASSHYEIKTPHGVAGIRGTDFQVSVTTLPNGGYTVTFTSVTGEVVVSATIQAGQAPVVKVLRTGESWTPGAGDVVPTPQAVITAAQTVIATLPTGPITVINIPTPAPPQKFTTGGTPSGTPSSGTGSP